MSGTYIIVCAPAGTGLSGAVNKLAKALGGSADVECADVESELCHSQDTRVALSSAIKFKSGDSPIMRDVTFYLSRDQVTGLCSAAVKAALDKLENSTKRYKLLSCHFIYYGSKRYEFYAAINPTSLVRNGILRPSHILLLIDDVYDMYLRLGGADDMYNPESGVQELLYKVAGDENFAVEALSDEELAYLGFSWKTGAMTQLLSWRHLEAVTAEAVAHQIGANFLLFGTKQLASAGVQWLKQARPFSVYLSHPISRIRRSFRQSGHWPAIVSEANELQSLLLPKVALVMPTAIDERRIKRESNSRGIRRREPELEPRWPRPANDNAELMLYSVPAGSADSEHRRIFEYQTWDHTKQCLCAPSAELPNLRDRTDALLRAFEQQFEAALASRDFLLVSLTNSIVVFRPFVLGADSSRGVSHELELWELLAKSDKNIDLVNKRKALFIHFEEDLEGWRKYYAENDKKRVLMETAIRQKLIDLVASTYSLNVTLAESVMQELDAAQGLLSGGQVHANLRHRIQSGLPQLRDHARQMWEDDQLRFGVLKQVSPDQVHVIKVRDMLELRRRSLELLEFLTRGTKPSSLETVAAETISSFTGQISLNRTRVVGHYYRHDLQTRKSLIEYKDNIESFLREKKTNLGNFLIWGASGSGKTSFLKEIRRDLQENLPQLNFVELNVAKMDIAEFERKMQEVKESRGAVLCLVDELTTKPEFFKSLFGHLKLNEEEPECRVAFALVGSLAEDLDGFVRSIEARKDDGGPDLIRRVPNRFTIPTAKPADLILVFAGKVVEAAEDKGCVVSEIEAACLFYVLVESLEGHRLESLARGAVSRLQPGETQIKFGHLFEMQHKHNEALERYEHLMGDLRDTFLSIEV